MIPKKLAQFVASMAETTVYTVPAATYTLLKEVVVANNSSSSQTVAMSLVPVGNMAGPANRLLPTVALGPNTVAVFNFSTVMATGDFLSVQASASSVVAVTISGLEDPGTGSSSGTGNFASTGMVVTSLTRPATPYDGQTIYETDTDRMLIWDGTNWEPTSVPIITSGARPSPVIEGQMGYESDTDMLRYYSGTAWITQTNLKMFNYGATNFGTAPAVDTGNAPFKVQTGSAVLSTDGSGDFTLTFPTAFPGGLLSVFVQQNDTTHPGASYIPKIGTASASSIGVRMYTSGGAAWGTSGNFRIVWLAIGW